MESYLSAGETTFYVLSNMMMTPGAMDVLRNKGIVISYSEKGDLERMIETQFGITDGRAVSDIARRVREKLNTTQGGNQ